MESVRLAKPEEVEAISSGSDLTPASTVFAFGDAHPDYAVFRLAPELDPVRFAPESSTRRRTLFIWALENGFRMMGTIPGYYFNVACSDKEWQENLESFGAQRVSAQPEFRYYKRLS